jgi:hypothetical protein
MSTPASLTSKHSGHSSVSASSSIRDGCCTLLLYKINKGRLLVGNQPLTWVGVAGFEPAASSSRTKRAAKLRYTPPTASAV